MITKGKIIIGIDVSKASLDICVCLDQTEEHFTIENKVSGIKKFFSKFKLQNEVLVAMENTGRYNWSLYEVLAESCFKIYVIPPLHLKRSLGLARGKNDVVDARRIAWFTNKHYEELRLWNAPRKELKQLKVLLTERNQRVKIKRQLRCNQKDYALMKSIELDQALMGSNLNLIKFVDEQIDHIEAQIEALIKSDEQLNKLAMLIRSVPGVGKILCWMMLAKTNEFNDVVSPRKMACYAGVAPFEHQSGTSVRRRPRVSVFADKALKSALHLGAMSAIRLNNDLGTYYKRKVEEGKNKMSVLNAVRNKIIHRIYAVVKNQKVYQNNLLLS